MEPEEQTPEDLSRRDSLILLASVFVIGGCGLIYELATGAVASYLLGDSVTQYSLVIGIFLAAMGVGSWISQFIRTALIDWFLWLQVCIAVFGGYSTLILYAAFAHVDSMTLVLLACTGVVGMLVGMEIPLILRMFKDENSLRTAVAHVLTFDYLGALVASVLFPFFVLPFFGLVRSSLVCGVLNLAVATLGTSLFWRRLQSPLQLALGNGIAWCLVLFGFVFSGLATSLLEDRLYQDEIIFSQTTPYQRIVVTRWKQDYRLHLNGHLQFSSRDEYRYHESLVLPALSATLASTKDDLRILVLGGGDGMVVRELISFDQVAHIDLVDIDPEVVKLFRDHPALSQLNSEALKDPRLHVHFADAMVFLQSTKLAPWDLIIMDLPDPSTVATNKLYTDAFFGMAIRSLSPRGVLVTQASSAFYAREAYWCIHETLAAAANQFASVTGETPRNVIPYHAYVPSFGDWGFIMVTPSSLSPLEIDLVTPGDFMSQSMFEASLRFPQDQSHVSTAVNQLDDPILHRIHEKGWSEWGE